MLCPHRFGQRSPPQHCHTHHPLFALQQRTFSDNSKVNTFSMIYFNALIALPLTLALAVATGELATLANYQYNTDAGFWAGAAIASCMGLLLTYSSLLSTTYNSALATSITGNAKDVATTIFGAILFPGFDASFANVSGLLLSFVGSGMYSYVNLQKALERDRQRQLVPAKETAARGGSKRDSSASGDSGDDASGSSVATRDSGELHGSNGSGSSSDGSAAMAPRLAGSELGSTFATAMKSR